MNDEETAGLTACTECALESGRDALDALADYWALDEPTDEQIDNYLDAVGDLFDAFVSIDAVLSRGGPLPAEWSPNPELENLERRSRYLLKVMTDAAIERHRSRGRLQLVQGGADATENASGGAQPRNKNDGI